MSRSLARLLALCLLVSSAPAGATPPDEFGFAEIGRWSDGGAGELDLDGDIAWYARGGRLASADLSDPARPTQLAMLELGNGARDLAAQDGWVYALVDGAVVVVDGRRPEHPREVTRLPVFGSSWLGRLELAGDVLYCVNDDLAVVDVSEPARPRLAGRLGGLYGRDVAAGGGRVFVAGHYGLSVLDASDPLAPVLLEVLDGGGSYCEANTVQVLDDLVLLGVRSNFFTLGMLVDGRPAGNLWWGGWGYPHAAARHGPDLYVADIMLSRYAPADDMANWLDDRFAPCGDVEIAGDLMVTTAGTDGVQTWSLGSGAEPLRLAALPAGRVAGHLFMDGDRAYGACGYSGLQVFDVSQPRRPLALGSCDDEPAVPRSERYRAEFVSARGNLALLGGVLGLRLVDVTDPAAPRLVRDIRTRDDGSWLRPLSAFTVDGGWLVGYDSTVDEAGRSGLLMVRPQAPDGLDVTLTDVARPDGWASYNCVSDGRLLYVTTVAGELRTWRVTADDALEPVGTVATGLARVQALAVADGFAYAAAAREVVVIDVRDPARMRRRGTTGLLPWSSNDGITQLAACDRRVFADFGFGLGLVDATDPDAPVGHEGYDLGGYRTVVALAAGDQEVYVGIGGTGLRVLRAHRAAAAPATDDPAAPRSSVAVAPNPCNPHATVSFTLAADGPAQVTVHDARGRRVRRLFCGTLGAGPQALAWAGDDDQGRAVASGAYLVRVTADGRTRTARVAVVR